jgi:hypothetical protein
VHTGQLFFDDSLSSAVFRSAAPYDTRPVADTTNQTDGIFQQAGASSAVLMMNKRGNGYVGSMIMGVNR